MNILLKLVSYLGGLLLLALLAFGIGIGISALAGADIGSHFDGQCSIVRERSHSKIKCSKINEAYLLDYPNSGVRTAVRWSGHYQDLLDSLCTDSKVVIEAVSGHTVKRYNCPE